MDTILITGAGGFLGQYLCCLLAKEYYVVGADLPEVKPVYDVEWKTVSEDGGLARLVPEIGPDMVIHAAFVNHKPQCYIDRQYLDKVIAVNLPMFEAMARINGKLLLISSSSVYGNSQTGKPIDETYPLRPISLYGLAKVLQETMAWYYSVFGLKVCIARLFNLSGPNQKCGMLLPDWVSQVCAIANGKTTELKIKHRKASRDFVDVRDASIAIALMARDFKSGEVFNVSSGKAVSLVDVGKELEKLCPVPLKIVETESKPSETDALIQHGSFDKIESTFGWRPVIDWRQSLKDLWNSYRL
jgi:GDP-4-dehydro-6-deoxy-D-mannose reductase